MDCTSFRPIVISFRAIPADLVRPDGLALFLQEWERELKEHGSTKRLKSLMAGHGRASAARSLAALAKADDMVDL